MHKLTHDDVRRLCGDLPDERVARMVSTGATRRDLEVALAWSAGNSDLMAETREPLRGRAAELYDLLSPELDEDEDPSRPV